MKDEILSVLESCKTHPGYYGITPFNLFLNVDYDMPDIEITLEELEKENKISITRSAQENITLICFLPSEESSSKLP